MNNGKNGSAIFFLGKVTGAVGNQVVRFGRENLEFYFELLCLFLDLKRRARMAKEYTSQEFGGAV